MPTATQTKAPRLYVVECPKGGLLNLSRFMPRRSAFLAFGGGCAVFSTKRAANDARLRTGQHAKLSGYPWAKDCRKWRVVPVKLSRA